MTRPDRPLVLAQEDFEALEEVLASDAVPEDCMDLEMLDGFLAGVLLSPRPVACERWMPSVWSAHGDTEIGTGSGVRKAIQLVLAYYNEMATTIGLEVDDDDRWGPFYFAVDKETGIGLGDAWYDGFAQGLDLWPEDWEQGLPGDIVDIVRGILKKAVAPWEGEGDADEVSEEKRLGWLEVSGKAVNDISLCWRRLGLPAPEPIEQKTLPPSAPEPGRNDPCPCGSGKKYKKCCGADRD